VESTIHALSKPHVLQPLALTAPPVLAWDFGSAGLHTGLSSLHITEHFDGISTATKVRINPVVTCGLGPNIQVKSPVFI